MEPLPAPIPSALPHWQSQLYSELSWHGKFAVPVEMLCAAAATGSHHILGLAHSRDRAQAHRWSHTDHICYGKAHWHELIMDPAGVN